MRRRRNPKLWNLAVDEFARHVANNGSAKTLAHVFLKGRRFRMRRATHLMSLVGLKCTGSVHPKCARCFHPKRTGNVHPKCASLVHPKCASDVRPECTIPEATC